MRAIKLELVRHGPPHNQLLSPLTPYLALCENHPPVTIHIPFEHNQFLYRLRDLYYKRDESAREFQLFEMGRTIGALLGQIPGLIAEVSREEYREGGEGLQLRLILSSSELALLPFELALSSEGLPGAGLPLVLQSDVPICITREVRRSRHPVLDGGQPSGAPRILFAWASPVGWTEVPYEAHLLALRRAVDPWWGTLQTPIDVLPRASIQDIEFACIEAVQANYPYTHVHILAHGVQTQIGFDFEYGLALHQDRHPDGEADRVLGERLATALGARSSIMGGAAVKPDVVTIASCYGGAQGSVAGAGASVAHALHVDGIPVVIAAQFPLTYLASVRMVEVLYERLLWGEDPRLAIADLRRSLHAELRRSHDWAGITAYAELDPEFETYLPYRRLDKIIGTIRIGQDYASFWAAVPDDEQRGKQKSAREKEMRRLKTATDRLQELLNKHFSRQPSYYDRIAPYWFQQGGSLFEWLARAEETRAQFFEVDGDLAGFEASIKNAHSNLWSSILMNRQNREVAAKYLWLEALLQHPGGNGAPKEDEDQERNPAEIWATAHALAIFGLHANRYPQERFFVLADLVMLYIVSLAFPRIRRLHEAGYAVEEALKHSRAILRDELGHFVADTVSASLSRYLRWYRKFHRLEPDASNELTAAVDRVLGELGGDVGERSKTGNLAVGWTAGETSQAK